MIITFCGHRELYDEKEVKVWLERVTENLIVNGAEKFYLGGYGAFDRLAASAISADRTGFDSALSEQAQRYIALRQFPVSAAGIGAEETGDCSKKSVDGGSGRCCGKLCSA